MTEAKQTHHPLFVVDDAHLLERESLLDLCALLALPARNTIAASLILIGNETFPKLLTLQVMAPVLTKWGVSPCVTRQNNAEKCKPIQEKPGVPLL